MMISKNFTLAELCNSAAAKRFGINNNPDDKVIKNLELLAKNILQPIRDHFDKAIHIVSGYRSPGLNKKVGGASNSQHLIGQAVDIDNDNTDITLLYTSPNLEETIAYNTDTFHKNTIRPNV